MRNLLSCIALTAAALAATPGTVLTSPHKVSWGWGCGGNCAVNFAGESETTLGGGPSAVRLEDRGTLTRRQSDPGGMTVTTTTWRYAFHGSGTTGSEWRKYTLHTDVSECTRTDEVLAEGKPASKKSVPCPGPPQRWKLACQRKQVEVKGQSRWAWVCSPEPPLDAFGSDFPWVFGIEAPITTVISGEPRPHTRYE